MSRKDLPRLTFVAFGASALLVTACSSSTTSQSPVSATTDATTSEAPASSASPEGSDPAAVSGQPDVNGDGKVVIGMMSPGDTNDNGYYQSFVDEARTFADSKGWSVITIDKVNPADAINQAKNLCRQQVDLVAIDSNELKDALGTASDSECAGVQYYINGGIGIEQGPTFAQSMDVLAESMVSVGYAAGQLMKEAGVTKAGFVSGPKADFTTQAAAGILAGMRQVVPDATLLETYTGDFNDSAKAKEAAQAQISNGIGLLYPYLGGATDAVNALAQENGVMTITPGTDRCEDPSATYDISAIFSPGAYFAAALREFAEGNLAMGETRVWHVGVDPVPTVRMCAPHEALQPPVNQMMADIGSGAVDPEALATSVGVQ